MDSVEPCGFFWMSSASSSFSISMIATPGGPFSDAAADEALFAAVRANAGPNVELVEMDTDINDPAFADAMVAKLHSYLGGAA